MTSIGEGDLDRMLAGLRTPQRRQASYRPEHDPDRDNMATILALALFVQDALLGAPQKEVERRLNTLRACVAAAKEAGMLTPFVDPTIDGMIEAVKAIHLEQRFTMTFDALQQNPLDLPEAPTPSMVSAGMQAGADDPAMVARVWQAFLGALRASAAG